jgi:hypothetical protein
MYAIVKNNQIIGGASDVEIAEWSVSNNDGASYLPAPENFTVYGFKVVNGVVVEKTAEDNQREKELANALANRKAAYPPFADYLDGVVKGNQAQIDAYIAACQAVKTKYPKPE